MLSILIPVYEFHVVELVMELNRQAQACEIEYEIICIDDKSSRKYIDMNASLESMNNVRYIKSAVNLGRAAIRNKLASMARFQYLLFMDCDSKVINNNYIADYVSHSAPDLVIYGGRCYDTRPPLDESKQLRWLYGTRRETTTAKQRNKHPYKSFMTNNLLIPKPIYMQIKMNERIKGYGHEDTAFGKQLKEHHIAVKHIDNPLCHIGLENAAVFLKKTEEGIRNLTYLIRKHLIDQDVRLYKYYLVLKRIGLLSFTEKRLRKRKERMRRNLLSGSPVLRNFDLYKLYCLIEALHHDVRDG